MQRRDSSSPSRILVIRLGALGDVLLATPLLRAMRKRYPESRIDVLVKKAFAPVLRGNPAVTNVLDFDPEQGWGGLVRTAALLRRNRYDRIVDLQKNFRSCFFSMFSGTGRVDRYSLGRWRRFFLVTFRKFPSGPVVPVALRYFAAVRRSGVEDDGAGLEMAVSDAAARETDGILRSLGVGPDERTVVLAPGAGRATKRWPADGYAGVGRELGRRGYRVLLVGGPADRAVCGDIAGRIGGQAASLAGNLTLEQSAAVVRKAALVVTNDTGLMHLAAALGRPVVAVFGPTTVHLGFFPFRAKSAVVEKDLDCRPCSFHGTDTCPKGHFRCMREISGDDVLRAADAWLE